MRLTVIVPDKTIIVDGKGHTGINTDWSWVPDNVHAVQWRDTSGHVEFNDGSSNETIEELGIYELAVTHHQIEDQRIQAEIEKRQYDMEWNRDWPRLLRRLRSMRLTDSDWTQVTDNSLTDEQRESWRVYRQQLRDLPSTLTEEQYRELVRDNNHELWPAEPS